MAKWSSGNEWPIEYAKKRGVNVQAVDSFRITLSGQSERILSRNRHVLETVLTRFEVQIVGIVERHRVKVPKSLDDWH